MSNKQKPDNDESIHAKQEDCDCNRTEKIGSIELDKIFQIDTIPNNSIICYKIQDIGKWIIPVFENFEKKFGKILKEKNVQLLVMREKDSIETVKEEQMNKMGWFKKGNIIVP